MTPMDHCIKLKGKDYLPVQWRLVWFREQCPHGTIETEMLHHDPAKRFAIFRAVVRDGEGGSASGTKSESAASFPDYIEKAETGAIGRALAALGYGTQFAQEELQESLPNMFLAGDESIPLAEVRAQLGELFFRAKRALVSCDTRANFLYTMSVYCGKEIHGPEDVAMGDIKKFESYVASMELVPYTEKKEG